MSSPPSASLLIQRWAVLTDMPPYPGGAKDADEWLMNGRDSDWTYERYGDAAGIELYRTRWLA